MNDRIAVVGVGKIGLCLAVNLARSNYHVLGIDIRRDYVAALADHRLESSEPGLTDELRAAIALDFAADLEAIVEFDPQIVFVTVDTPTVYPAGYDHSRVDCVLEDLFALAKPEQRRELVIMCTTLPGYCDTKAEITEAHGYALSYNPVFVAQGSILRNQRSPDQVLIGEADHRSGERIVAVHRRLCGERPAIHRMDRLSAEIAKLATNCLLTTKIVFANAVGDLATKVGAQADKILESVAADSRIGPGCLRYGFGFGGPCFPRDNKALGFFAENAGIPLLQADTTVEMNHRHLCFQEEEYLSRYGDDEPIHFHGVTYKPETDILEESQALALAESLARAGRRVVIHEQASVVEILKSRFDDLFEYASG